MSAAPALRTFDLAVGYRTRGSRRAVLERVNLAVQPGELVCLLGPNGIGKSTLLRTLARMQPPLWGSIELGGVPLNSLSATDLARRLGVVLTERVAVDALSVRGIVEIGRYPHSGWLGRLTEHDHGIVDWAIDASGARRLVNRDFSRLSDGERQRVMVARALAQEPLLLMLDEPTAFLDVPARVELMGLLRQLTRDASIAVIVSTHDLELALRTADVVWLVLPGGELMTGAPEDVVVSGGIAQAFEGRRIRFHAEERSFRWLTGDRGSATVQGEGLPAAMARAVLEREGYEVNGANGTTGTDFTTDTNCTNRANGTSTNGTNGATRATGATGANYASSSERDVGLTVVITETGWRLRTRNGSGSGGSGSGTGHEIEGDTFRSLATHVRAHRSRVQQESE
jgi:iron complex transport system ATP-binding protein